MGKVGEGGQKVQTSNYKINEKKKKKINES